MPNISFLPHLKKNMLFLLSRCYILYVAAGVVLVLSVNHQKVIFKVLDAFRRSERDTILCAQGQKPLEGFILRDTIRYYRNIIALIPDSSIARSILGFCYYQAKEYDHAIASYKKAIGFDSDYCALYFNLGSIYYELKDYPEAIFYFKKAMEVSPEKTLMYRGFVDPYAKEDIQDSKTFQQVRINSLKVMYLRSFKKIILSHYYLKNYEEILKYALKASGMDSSESAFFYYHAAVAAYHLKNYKQTVNFCSKALNAELGNPDIYKYLHLSLKKMGLDVLAQRYEREEKELRSGEGGDYFLSDNEQRQELYFYAMDAKRYFHNKKKQKAISLR